MIPSGYDAWKYNETLRQCFEVVSDTAASPPEHSAYVCKCCWEQFPASTELMKLIAHAGGHESQGELPYSSARPSPITGEQVFDLYHGISEHFEAVTPEVGTWKFQCRRCKKLLPHRTAHKDLMWHARTCPLADSRGGKMQLTSPSYISQQMFDKALREKFQDNPDDEAVRQQAMKLIQLVRGSQSRERTLVDIMHAAKVSGHTSKEQTAEIAFCMGLQFGFELALSYPPLPSSRPVG
jgi:hypothetical protein